MSDIYIARHGTTEANKKKIYMGTSGEGLAPEGKLQAERLGNFLRPLGIHRIYSSPLRRAVETSEIINQDLNVPIQLEEDLTEMRLGPWMGMSEEEVAEKYPKEHRLWNSRPPELVLPGRETLAELQSRALKAIYKIKENSQKYPVLAITHVALIRCIIMYFQDLDIDLYKTIDVPNISVFRLRVNEGLANISRYL
jgi:broad specificity phosphatase PhoE